MCVIKIKGHAKMTEPEYQSVAHVDEVHCFFKNGPSLPDFCHPDVLKKWQQSVSESETLRWVNNNFKLNIVRPMENTRQLFVFF